MRIRTTQSEDIPALKLVLDKTQLFPSVMLPGMLDSYFSNPENEDIWLTLEDDNSQPIGFCYAAPEQLATGTWNMLAIAVLPEQQGNGFGRLITLELEAMLRDQKSRILIAETSGTDDFRMTREFYEKAGYTEEARIRDFWDAGDDKVVFWKRL